MSESLFLPRVRPLPSAPGLVVPPSAVVPTDLNASRTAVQKRAENPLFVPMWSAQALQERLPFEFPVPPGLPLSPKVRYRSGYCFLGSGPLLDRESLLGLTPFRACLYLIDFSPLERELAQGYRDSAKGQVPYHPVSMFLAACLRREQNYSWRQTATVLRGEEGESWRRLFGFAPDQVPGESGLRYFYHHVMRPALFADLCARTVGLLCQHGLFPESSTFPGDRPDRGITVSQDGMLHGGLHRDCCHLVTDECFQALAFVGLPPTEPALAEDRGAPSQSPVVAESAQAVENRSVGGPADEPEVSAGRGPVGPDGVPNVRLCRARELGHEGCRCETPECQAQCQHASRRDPESRLIHHAGHNYKHGEKPVKPKDQTKGSGKAPTERRSGKGRDVFGDLSIAERALDDRFAVGWLLQSGLYSANTDERTVFEKRVDELVLRYPDLKIGEWLGDSGTGYGPCLERVYELGALRMIDIRADKGDTDPAVCRDRGYDGQGRPLCPHGYRMRANGYDYDRRLSKYVCVGACRREPLDKDGPVGPVEGCPYLPSLAEPKPVGFVTTFGKTMKDGSVRLAREIPYDSPTWKARYARRNGSESRNAQIEGLGLKRMISYGLDHNRRDLQLSDFLLNLRTIGRLVLEASRQQMG